MAERVSTGGTREFIYNGERPSLSDAEKKEIRSAYNRYYERKRIERKRRNFIIAVAFLIILIALFLIFMAILK